MNENKVILIRPLGSRDLLIFCSVVWVRSRPGSTDPSYWCPSPSVLLACKHEHVDAHVRAPCLSKPFTKLKLHNHWIDIDHNATNFRL